MLYIWFSANESAIYRFFPRLASLDGWVIDNDMLSIKAKNKQATFFYIKMKGILPKPEVYSEPSQTSKKELHMRHGRKIEFWIGQLVG